MLDQRRHRSWPIAAPLVWALLVALTACGSSDASSAQPTAPAPPADASHQTESTGAPQTAVDVQDPSATPGSAPAAASDGPLAVDPCSLLTPDDVVAAIGIAGTANGATSLTGEPECTWSAGTGPAIAEYVKVTLESAGLCATARTLQANPAVTGASGNTFFADIGDGALYSSVVIEVTTPRGCFHVDGTDSTSTPLSAAIMAAVARAAVSHLG